MVVILSAAPVVTDGSAGSDVELESRGPLSYWSNRESSLGVSSSGSSIGGRTVSSLSSATAGCSQRGRPLLNTKAAMTIKLMITLNPLRTNPSLPGKEDVLSIFEDTLY